MMQCALFVITAALTAQAGNSTASSPAATRAFAEILGAQDAARKALYAKIAPSIVTVTSYLKVPPGTLLEGKWKIADESPYKGYMRQQVASGILLDDTGLVLCCRSPLAL